MRCTGRSVLSKTRRSTSRLLRMKASVLEECHALFDHGRGAHGYPVDVELQFKNTLFIFAAHDIWSWSCQLRYQVRTGLEKPARRE